MIKCRRCGAEIGKTLDIWGLELVQLAGVACREVRGRCVQCGEPFLYSVSEKQIESLISNVVGSNKDLENKIDRAQLIYNMRASQKTWREIAEVAKCSKETCQRIYRRMMKSVK